MNKGSTFFVDWDPPCIGIVSSDGKKSGSKGNFAIKLDKLVEAGLQTGYLAWVKRGIPYCEKRLCFFTLDTACYKYQFMKQVNNCFGSVDLTLGLSKNQFSCFFHFLREDASSLQTVKAITHIGRQENGTWVLNKETQMAADGEVIPKEDQQYVWLDETFPKKFTKIPLSELGLQVTLPPDSRILSRLIEKMECFMQHNFLPSVLMLGGAIMSFHYNSISSATCPIMVVEGDSHDAKSTLLNIAMSLVGVPKDSIYEQVTNTIVFERSSVGTLPFAINEPASKRSKGRDLNEVVVVLFNKGMIASMRKTMTPKSIPLVATNYKLKSEPQSVVRVTDTVRSRVCIVPFSAPMIAASTGDQLAAFDDVQEMVEQNLLSQALGWIIRQATTVCDMEQLWNAMEKLENAFQGRALMNWGLVALTTSKLLEEAGRHDLIDPVLEFVRSLSPAPTGSCDGNRQTNKTATDVLHTKDAPLHKESTGASGFDNVGSQCGQPPPAKRRRECSQMSSIKGCKGV